MRATAHEDLLVNNPSHIQWLGRQKVASNRKMYGLDLAYKFLSLGGYWIPQKWESRKNLRIIYRIYSVLVIGCMWILVALQALLLVTSDMDFQYFVNILFTFLISISMCVKGVTFLSRRGEIIRLEGMLKKHCCLPMDSEELRMQKTTDNLTRKLTIFFNANTQTTLLLFFLTPFFQDQENIKLPYQIWLPNNYLQRSNFWILHFVEYWLLLPSLLLVSTSDTIIFGYILQTSNQFDFIKHRIKRLCEIVGNDSSNYVDRRTILDYELKKLKKCVQHHNHVVEFSNALMKTFDLILMHIYFSSVMIISVIVYEFSMDSSSILQKVKSVAYFICMALEILFFCWYGDELTLKSSGFGYNDHRTNWLVLSEESKKMLRFMTLRTTYPTVISFSGVINFNLQSFRTIMKVTYSAFNLMKRFS